MQKRQDYWLAHPPKQPKREIGEYIRRHRIPVPDTYSTLIAAKKSGKPLIARSEHPQDYAGASGVAESPRIRNDGGKLAWVLPSYLLLGDCEGILPQPDSESNILKVIQSSSTSIPIHCRLAGINEDAFRRDLTFSLWELLPGLNLKICGDSSIEGRYHVTALYGSSDGIHVCGYAVYDKDKTTIRHDFRTENFFNDNRNSLIELYEKICNLDRFNPNHRPIIEVQYWDGKLYFLQYHRARDFEPATFVLDRPREKNEIEALFVRGATPPNGSIWKTTFCYSLAIRDGMKQVPPEDGSFDHPPDPIRTNHMAGSRKLQIKSTDYFPRIMAGISMHTPISELCKPQVFIVADESRFPQFKCGPIMSRFLPSVVSPYYRAVEEFLKGDRYQLDIKVTSDGNRAYLEVLENPLKTYLLYAYGCLLEIWRKRGRFRDAVNNKFDKIIKQLVAVD
ncbi:MAG: hypothetical protein PHS02_03410 [Candidatus ainarchaeum sp.]|nr:hypothetical protein [Candidatus ainarchaeum sp.]